MNKVILLVLFAVATSFCGETFTRLNVVSAAPRSVDGNAGVWWGSNDKGPVNVWFHGGMTSSDCEKGQIAGRDFYQMLPQYTTVSVSACKNNHWVTRNAIEWVDAALDSIAARRGSPVDTVNLVGISDGGLGVLSYASWGKRSQKNRLLMSAYGPSLGSAQDVAAQLAPRKGSWRFMQGGADRLYPAQETIAWDAVFCKNIETECDMKYDPAGEHDWSYWQNKRKKWILEFFSAKPLTKTR